MNKVNYKFALPVSIIKEDDSFIAYSPALDLSTVGDSFEEAQDRFEEAVQIFFEELDNKGTTEEVLTELGWQRQGSELTPPVVVSNSTREFSVPNFSLKYA